MPTFNFSYQKPNTHVINDHMDDLFKTYQYKKGCFAKNMPKLFCVEILLSDIENQLIDYSCAYQHPQKPTQYLDQPNPREDIFYLKNSYFVKKQTKTECDNLTRFR